MITAAEMSLERMTSMRKGQAIMTKSRVKVLRSLKRHADRSTFTRDTIRAKLWILTEDKRLST